MNGTVGNVFELVDMLRQKAPEYIDLMTATTDGEFEKAFDALLQKAVMHLEANKKNFSKLDEVGLSAVLAATLSIPGLSVSQETHSNGHVDLTIEADHCMPARKKLGEAKIYDGQAYHFQGLKQLLSRYSTGREGRGLLIIYCRKANIASLVASLRQKMDKDLPLKQQGRTIDYNLKWSFLSNHEHTCGDNLQVGHIGCNLYIEPTTNLQS